LTKGEAGQQDELRKAVVKANVNGLRREKRPNRIGEGRNIKGRAPWEEGVMRNFTAVKFWGLLGPEESYPNVQT